MRTMVLALALALAGCGSTGVEGEPQVPSPSIEEVLAEHAPALMSRPGVVTVYQGALDDGSPCVKIGVKKLTDALAEGLPETLEGYPVEIIETGEIGRREGEG